MPQAEPRFGQIRVQRERAAIRLLGLHEIALVDREVAREGVGRGEIRTQLQGLRANTLRIRNAPEHPQRDRECGLCLRIARVEPETAPKALDRILGSAEIGERLTQPGVGIGVIGIGLQRLPVAVGRFVEPAQITQHRPQVIEYARVPRSEPQGLAVAHHGLFELSEITQRIAEVAMGVDEPRIEVEGVPTTL